jgi:hypothetical protein
VANKGSYDLEERVGGASTGNRYRAVVIPQRSMNSFLTK